MKTKNLLILATFVGVVIFLSSLKLFPPTELKGEEKQELANMIQKLREAPEYSILEFKYEHEYLKEAGFFHFGIVCGHQQNPERITYAVIGLSSSGVCATTHFDLEHTAKGIKRVISPKDGEQHYNNMVVSFVQRSINREKWLKDQQEKK